MRTRGVFVALALCLLVVSGVADEGEEDTAEAAEATEEEESDETADEEAELVHPLTDMPEAKKGVMTAYVLPGGKTFTIGEKVTVLAGVINNADRAINVSHIIGSLNSPFQFRHHLQNFSKRSYGAMVAPNSEATFEYTFWPSESVDPVEFRVAATVFYEDEDEHFSATFFNETVTFMEPPSEVTFATLFTYVVMSALVAGLLFLAYQRVSTTAASAANAPRQPTGGGHPAVSEADWTDGLLGAGAAKKRGSANKKLKKK